MTHTDKENLVVETADRWDLDILVETGTFRGDMVHAVKSHFDHVYTIELDPTLAQLAQLRFAQDNVTVLQGDSATRLAAVVASLARPTLYWLDAHSKFGEQYAGHPLLNELEAIRRGMDGVRKVILIDDMHLLGREDFPTEDEVLQNLDGKEVEHIGPVWRVS